MYLIKSLKILAGIFILTGSVFAGLYLRDVRTEPKTIDYKNRLLGELAIVAG